MISAVHMLLIKQRSLEAHCDSVTATMWLSHGSPVASPASVPMGSIRAQGGGKHKKKKKPTVSLLIDLQKVPAQSKEEMQSPIFVLRRVNELRVLFPKGGFLPVLV